MSYLATDKGVMLYDFLISLACHTHNAMTGNTSRESYLADGWMYGRTGKLNRHLLTQGLDQKVDNNCLTHS